MKTELNPNAAWPDPNKPKVKVKQPPKQKPPKGRTDLLFDDWARRNGVDVSKIGLTRRKI